MRVVRTGAVRRGVVFGGVVVYSQAFQCGGDGQESGADSRVRAGARSLPSTSNNGGVAAVGKGVPRNLGIDIFKR